MRWHNFHRHYGDCDYEACTDHMDFKQGLSVLVLVAVFVCMFGLVYGLVGAP
jgi:hypothetical protein